MDDEANREKRQSFLVFFYVLAFGCAFSVLLFAICGGLAVQMIAVSAGVGAFALLHWLLWGHYLARERLPDPEAEKLETEAVVAEEDPYRGRY